MFVKSILSLFKTASTFVWPGLMARDVIIPEKKGANFQMQISSLCVNVLYRKRCRAVKVALAGTKSAILYATSRRQRKTD